MATSILPDQARQRRLNIKDRPEPPKCPYNNRYPEIRHPDGMNYLTCPTCIAHNRWVAACRRDRVAAGLHIPVPCPPRIGRRRNPELRKPAPKCGLTHRTPDEKRTCRRCKARNAYTQALRQDAVRAGQPFTGLVDIAEVVQHITKVLLPSGLTFRAIAQQSGVTENLISRAANGRHTKMHSLNAAAILSVKPLPYRQGNARLVNATGTRRTLRGLYAQGWMVGYMAGLLGLSLDNLWKQTAGLATGKYPREFVNHELAEAVKRLADKLGPFDIAELDKPMDGMSWMCARRAAKRGWNVLADWDGLAIDDPRINPHGYDETLDASNGLVLVDYDKVKRVLGFVPVEAADGSLSAEQFALPLTKMEIYEVIRVGSERDHAGEPRFSANLLGQRIGANERTVIRYRSEMARANWLLDAGPALPVAAATVAFILAAAEWPAALRLQVASSMLGPYPLGRGGFYRYLVILGATQQRPVGRQWSDTQFADWLGCTEEGASTLRARAALSGRQYQEFRTDGRTGRSRSLGFQLPSAAA